MPALPWLNTQKKRDHKHTQDCGFVAGMVCFLPLFQFRTVGSVKLFIIIIIIIIIFFFFTCSDTFPFEQNE